MIAHLKGIILELSDHFAVIDVGGVGYRVFVSLRTRSDLSGVGQQASVWTITDVAEDRIHLYGFSGKEEREWFQLLTTVQGVGNKMAMALLSAISPSDIALAVSAQDAAVLTRAKGVGNKLATRIVTELKGKVEKIGLSSDIADIASGKGGTAGRSMSEDAVLALLNLGYTRTEASMAVSRAMKKKEGVKDVGELIRLALKEFNA